MDLQSVKARFGIIGNSKELIRAIEIAIQVAPTELSVLILGESGVGKEIFSQIIHSYSTRKHQPYIAVNCGAIPQGTIDSELFGHEKGAFTGATESRKGYFEVVDNGTIFLDEVAELPLASQVRLLRVLETGEFIRVGSSKSQKTNVRVIAATNVNFNEAISKGRFREDLYYRLSTVPIHIPPLRQRGDDIYLLFVKFAYDFGLKYKMPPVELTPDAKQLLISYHWPGNVRHLKNVTEQLSIIEQKRQINAETLKLYLKDVELNKLPAIIHQSESKTYSSEREILFNFLFDIKKELDETKKAVNILLQQVNLPNLSKTQQNYDDFNISKFQIDEDNFVEKSIQIEPKYNEITRNDKTIIDTEPIEEENLSLAEMEKNMIFKALLKHNGKRKLAADELGISERTLYRKIQEYNIDM